MIIDLIALRGSPFEFEFSLAPEEIDLESNDAKLKSAVKIKGKLTKHIAQTDVQGVIRAELEAPVRVDVELKDSLERPPGGKLKIAVVELE